MRVVPVGPQPLASLGRPLGPAVRGAGAVGRLRAVDYRDNGAAGPG